MEQKQISFRSTCDRLPSLSAKYPWLVAQRRLEDEKDDMGDQILFTINDLLSHYRCQIPELLGRRIRGCFHGWVILSNHPHNTMWSLWNPVTSKTMHLPSLILKDGDYETIRQCCLSSPPDDPVSVLLLTRTKKPTFVFCRLDSKRKRLRWTEMTYTKQLKSITGDHGFLHCLTCCNGKLYALKSGRYNNIAIQIDIVVKDREVVISLLPFGKVPFTYYNNGCSFKKPFLKGCCTELFFVKVGFDEVANKTLGAVYLFKFNMTSMIWEEMEDLKDAIIFVDLGHNCSIFYRPEIASELGGYIHFLGNMGKVIYSYHVKDKTISLSSLPCLVQRSHVSLWECRLQCDHGPDFKPEDEIVVRSVRDDKVNNNSTMNEPHEKNIASHLFNIPFDVLEMIMEFCVGVEYLNFRATCKYCQLAAPMIQWSNETALRRLQTYSLVSSWLTMFDKHRGIITFTDPMSGDKYFIKTPRELIGDLRIYCSRYGWLLLFKFDGPRKWLFFNPFTNDIRELPVAPGLDSLCFSAPPTSSDCMVVGFSASLYWHVYIYFVSQEPSWRMFQMDFGGSVPRSFLFPTFYGRDIYALNGGALNIFREREEGYYFWDIAVAEAPRGCCRSSAQYFLVKCDQHLLLVIMDEFGDSVEVFKLNHSTQEWEKIDSLGRHMIYICGTTCLCTEAKTPEMENKIYFPRLHSENEKIVFYSLETCMYHTFNSSRNIEECFKDFCATKYHLYPHAWIEPSWS